VLAVVVVVVVVVNPIGGREEVRSVATPIVLEKDSPTETTIGEKGEDFPSEEEPVEYLLLVPNCDR